MALNLTPVFKELGTQGASILISQITGEAPIIERYGDYNNIVLTNEQELKLQEFLLSQLNKEPGPVRLDMGGIVLPVVIKKYWPWAVGAVAVGGVLGVLIGKAGRRKR